MTHSNEGPVQVTDRDREAASVLIADVLKGVGFIAPESIEKWETSIAAGECDTHAEVQAFAHHRSDNTDELVGLLERAAKALGDACLTVHDELLDEIDAALASHKERQT